MYDPLALDRQRIEQERLRRRTEVASRRPEPADAVQHESGRHFRVTRRLHRRTATAC